MQPSSNLFADGPVPSLLELGRLLIAEALSRFAHRFPHMPLLAVDGTCGNGHDTCFLAQTALRCAPGKAIRVFAFDVQQQAINGTAQRLASLQLEDCVELVHRSHASLKAVLEEQAHSGPCCAVAVYNLGYLPGSDKSITTLPQETLASLEQAAQALAPGGLLAVHAYAGHPGGMEEASEVAGWFSRLDYAAWSATAYTVCNKTRNPETLFLAQKRAER